MEDDIILPGLINLHIGKGTEQHTDATDPGDKNTNNETDTNQTDQLPATGTDTLGIGAFTLAMLCCGAALGVLLRRRTRN